MFCTSCGAEISDGARYCKRCGASVTTGGSGVGSSGAPHDPSGDGSATSEAGGQTETLEPAVRNRPKKGFVIGALAVIALVIVGVTAFLLTWPPELTEQIIEGDMEGSSITVTPEWGSQEAAVFTTLTLDSVESTTVNGVEFRRATVEAQYENENIRVTSEWLLEYKLVDGAWVLNDVLENERTLTPINSIDDATIIDHIAQLIALADESPYKDASGSSHYLEKIYSDDATFEVIENTTADGDGQVTIALSAPGAIASYEGTLVATFSWSDEQGDWQLNACSADRSAYLPNYDSLLGTWEGTFVAPEGGRYGTDHNCNYGSTAPLSVTVTEVDSELGTMTVDMTFAVHDHDDPDFLQASVTGDRALSASAVLVPIELDEGYEQIYYSDMVTSETESGRSVVGTVYFNLSSDGTWTAYVGTIRGKTKDDIEDFMGFSRYDTYELVHVESEG